MWNGGGVTRKAARCLSNRAGAAPLGSLFAEVEESTAAALRRVLGADWAGAHDASGMVAVAGSRINADYQCNAALRLSKAAGRPPRTLATDIVTALRRDENASLLGSAEVAGPGFVNMKINDERLVSGVRRLARDGLPRHAFRAPGSPRNGLPHRGRRVLVDFASPNMAKELHVGHMRSSVIGDTLCRCLEWLGYDVDRVSHVGDLGMPVCLVVASLLDRRYDGDAAALTPAEMSAEYEAARARADADPEFAAAAQSVLRELQGHDAGKGAASRTVELWQGLCSASRTGYGSIFGRLGVVVSDRGESTYVTQLEDVVGTLLSDGVARESQGAVGVFVDGDDKPPLLVRKKDGGFLYATIDAAALRSRLSGDYGWCVYVVDASQSLHFKQLFNLGELAGWLTSSADTVTGEICRLDHAAFGVVQGSDGRKLSSRDGTDLTLTALLDDSVAASSAAMDQLFGSRASSSPLRLNDDDVDALAVAIGHSAVRFYDLGHQRTSDYVFSAARALASKGATSVYLMYAVARLEALRRNLHGIQDEDVDLLGGLRRQAAFDSALEEFLDDSRDRWGLEVGDGAVSLSDSEHTLALALLRVPDIIADTVATLSPHHLAEHTLHLAQAFHAFYDSCRVVGSEEEQWRAELCAATDAALRRCMSLLGVRIVDRM